MKKYAELTTMSVFFIFFSIMMVSEIIVLGYEYNARKARLPKHFGNTKENISSIPDKKADEFSFALIGDTEGCGIFERIYQLLEGENISFKVFLGDIVRRSNAGEHKYLTVELDDEVKSLVPSFYIVGNHDIDERNFPLKKFESIYGPTNFHFKYKTCLFIGLRILEKKHYSSKESVEYLETVLKENYGDCSKTFVFFHIPPPIFEGIANKEIEDWESLTNLIERYNVEYVFMGDYHGYRRVKIKNTDYIITGGGGAHLVPSKYGYFHHLMVIKVNKDKIEEKILKFEREQDLEDIIEHSALAEIYPWIEENLFITIIVNLIFASILILLGFGIYRKIKLLITPGV